MMPAVIYVLPPEENTQACEENARSVCHGDHHCAVKKLLETPDYLALGMKKRGFWNGLGNFTDKVIDKAFRGSEGPLRAFFGEARI